MAWPTRKIDLNKWNMLSNELKVAVKIEDLSDKGITPYFSILTKELEKEMSPSSVHTSIDRLVDLGMIGANWTKVGTKWVRGFCLAEGEDKKFIEDIRKHL